MRSRILNLLILFGGIFLVFNLIRSIASISEKGKIIDDAQRRLIDEGEKNSKLKRELAKINSPEYIEQQAREKLNLGKAGEYAVILPSISPEVTPTPSETPENWEAWMRVFWP